MNFSRSALSAAFVAAICFLLPTISSAQTPIGCQPGIFTGPSASSHIASVTLAGDNDTLANNSGQGPAAYNDFTTGQTIPDLTVGGTYTLTVSGAAVAGAWIDYDGNGTLAASEWLDDCTMGSGSCNITFTVPCSATNGPVVLRVMGQINNVAGSGWETSSGPCGTYSTAEAEDYTVTIGNTAVISGLDTAMCTTEAPITYTGNAGGSWSSTFPAGFTDNGDGTATYDPSSTAPGGPYTVTYTTACSAMTTGNVTINSGSLNPTSSGLSATYCPEGAQTALIGSPTGGTFTGPGTTQLVVSDTVCIFDQPGGPDDCMFSVDMCAEQSNNITTQQTSANFTLTNANNIASIDYQLYFSACGGTSTFTFYVNGVQVDTWSNATNTCQCSGPGDFDYPYTHTVTGAALNTNWNFGGNNTVAVMQDNPNNFVAGYRAIVNYNNGSAAFDPTLVAPGSAVDIVYIVPSGGCDNADVQTTTILAVPPVDGGGDIDLCIGSTATMTATGALSYSWNQGLGGGATKMVTPTTDETYVVTGTDANGCVATDTVDITIIALPTVGFSNLDSNYEVCDVPANLTGTPAGGTFSGPGTSGTQFDPAAAGIGGPYTITYSYTDSVGCTSDSALTTTVLPFSGVSMTGLPASTCEQQGLEFPIGMPNGGSFSGPGVVSASTTADVCIYDAPGGSGNCVISSDICQSGQVPNPGPQTSAQFELNNATAVSSIDFYLYFSCGGGNATFSFYLNGVPIDNLNWTDTECLCVPANGTAPYLHTVSGANVSNNFNLNGNNTLTVDLNDPAMTIAGYRAVVHYDRQAFDPATAGAGGPYNVVYNYTIGSCSGADSMSISVNAAPAADAGMDVTLCQGQSTTLTGTGGTSQAWDNGLGAGSSHTVTPATTTDYILTTQAANNCENYDTVTVTVNPLPDVSFSGLTPTLFDCSDPDTLVGMPGGGLFSGPGLTGNIFDPQAVGIGGPYSITYTYTDGNGCTNDTTESSTVSTFTTVTFSGLNTFHCAEEAPQELIGSPAGGTFSGPGLVNTQLSQTICILDVPGTGAMDDCQFDVLNICNEGNTPTTNLESVTGITLNQAVSIDYIEFELYYTALGGTTTFDLYVNNTQVGSFTSFFSSAGCPGPGDATYPKTVLVPGSAVSGIWNIGGTNELGVQQNNPQTFVAGYRAVVYYESTAEKAFDPGLAGVGGPYDITYTFTDGTCTGMFTHTVTGVNPAPAIDAGTDQTVCSGDAATLTATGGNSYTWNNGLGSGASQTVSPVDSTMYIVTGTGANGCQANDTVMVNIIPPIVVDAGPDQTACAGDSVTLTATGADTYLWDSGLGAGASQTVAASNATYIVTGTSLGCSRSDTVSISLDPVPVIDTTNMVIFDPPCGQNTGTISGITATGTGTVTFEWFNNANQSLGVQINQSSLPAGFYTLVATDAICSTSLTISVDNDGAPAPPTSSGGASYCAGDQVTDLSVTGSGGTFTWYDDALLSNQVGTGSTFSPDSATTATYYVTETSAGCESNPAAETVTINPIPTADAGMDDDVCDGDTYTLTATGGTSYTWDNGLGAGATQLVSPTTNTTYNVTVTAAGCSATAAVTLTVIAAPTADAGMDQTVCQGSSVTLTATGGVTHNWTWATGSITANSFTTSVPNAGVNSYTVEAVAANGCTDLDTVVVTANAQPNFDLGPDQSLCEGLAVTLTASGGGTYTWNNGLPATASNSVSPSVTTTYMVTVTGTNTCTSADTVTITVNPLPTVDTTNVSVTNSDCTSPTGSVTGITASGSGTIIYTWTDNNSTIVGNAVDLTNVSGGSYSLTVSANGCSVAGGTFGVSNSGAPAAPGASSPAPYCPGETVADLTATGTGGVIRWYDDPGLTNQVGLGSPFNSGATSNSTFYVTETLAGCESVATQVNVVFNSAPTAGVTSDFTLCEGESASVTATGGVIYLWDNGLGGGPTQNVSPTTTTTYTVTVTDATTCSDTASVTVTVVPAPTAGISNDTTICAGNTVNLTATGGVGYEWNNGLGAGQNQTVTPTASTTYTVTITDGNGCTATASVAITTIPTVQAVANANIVANDSVITIVNTSSNAQDYLWDFGDGTTSTAENPGTHTYSDTGTYTVTLTVSNNCTTDDTTFTLNVNWVGVAEVMKRINFSAYPNPAAQLLNIQLTGQGNDLQWQLMDATGKQVKAQRHGRYNGLWRETIDLSDQASGVYFLRVVSTEFAFTTKVTVQR